MRKSIAIGLIVGWTCVGCGSKDTSEVTSATPAASAAPPASAAAGALSPRDVRQLTGMEATRRVDTLLSKCAEAECKEGLDGVLRIVTDPGEKALVEKLHQGEAPAALKPELAAMLGSIGSVGGMEIEKAAVDGDRLMLTSPVCEQGQFASNLDGTGVFEAAKKMGFKAVVCAGEAEIEHTL